METRDKQILYYVTVDGSSAPFRVWREAILDKRLRAAIDARIARMRAGNFSDSRPIGSGASENRIDFGPGFRIYYGLDGDKVILLWAAINQVRLPIFRSPSDIGRITGKEQKMKRAENYKADLLEDLRNDAEYAAEYLTAAKADSTEAFLVALRDVAEARKGMKRVAKEAKVNRENLYRALSKRGNPRIDTVDAVLNTLGLQLVFRPRKRTRRS